jgi:polysaccharide biosynthesis protein PslH
MRILVVGDDFPWPANRGGLIRLSQSIEALSTLGEVDLFTLYDRRRTSFPVPEDLTLGRVGTTPYPTAAPAWRWRAAWLRRGGLPLELALRSFDTAPRTAFERWTRNDYDVVWFDTISVYTWVGSPRGCPSLVDVDNLEDQKGRQWAGVLRSERHGKGAERWIRKTAAAIQSDKNARNWDTLQRSVAEEVARIVLCSGVDVRRSGVPNAVEIPNGYSRQEHPVGRVPIGDPPTVVFQGTLTYGPNMDGAEWLVERVLPHLRARVPDVRIRLVGNPAPAVSRLHDPPAVTVVGRVPEIEAELARADLTVVPLRVGSGTRLKILESFAHRVPVVSTSLGAEGIEVTDGVEILIADDPAGFAAACHRLLVDERLRKGMVDAASEVFLRRYEWSVVRERIVGLVTEVAAGAPPEGSFP